MNERYFLSTVRYEKMMENGMTKTVNEQYLFDAISFGEAETRTVYELTAYIGGEFSIPKISSPRFTELMLSNEANADRYYKVKAVFITLDEKTSTEKKTTFFYLVQAQNFKDAYNRFIEGMKSTMMDYEIVSIVETQILDYFPANHNE